MTVPRFLAFVGEPGALRAHLSALMPSASPAHRLDRRFDSPELVVFTSPESPLVRLEEDRGLVVGRLYRRRDASEPVRSLGLSASRHAAWSSGRSLISDFWGSYVAFLRDDRHVAVLRDPSARVPAYYCEAGEVCLYFSDEALGREGGMAGTAVDEEFLRQWLSFPYLRTGRTGLSGVAELLPGAVRRSHVAGSPAEAAWSPWRFAAGPQLTGFHEAATGLRGTVLDTVAVQLAEAGGFALQLSGGLDSSIVAASLALSGTGFAAATFATRMPDGDERDYARAVAVGLGVPLAELPEDDAGLDLSPPAPALRPPLSPLLQPLNRALSRHAAATAVRAFATGAGGDNLFCYLSTTAPILDAFGSAGLRQGAATLCDVSVLGECTLWTAAAYAVRKRIRLRRRPRWKGDHRFLAPEAAAGEPDRHFWLEAPDCAMPGKLEHVASLVRAQYFMEPRQQSGEEVIHPLINQPLIELCLAIPTWLWVRGGRNRAVARAAFADLLPPRIINRRSKGRLESMCARAYARARPALADLLLAGELRQTKLLDASAVETYLADSARPSGDAYYRLLDLAALELWLRSRRG